LHKPRGEQLTRLDRHLLERKLFYMLINCVYYVYIVNSVATAKSFVMSPAKTPKKSAEDDFEAVSMNKEVQKLKTGNTVTPKRSVASKLTIDDNDSGTTPTGKITRKLKTPSKESGVEQTKTLNTPKGNSRF
jgi:hypothetical protein